MDDFVDLSALATGSDESVVRPKGSYKLPVNNPSAEHTRYHHTPLTKEEELAKGRKERLSEAAARITVPCPKCGEPLVHRTRKSDGAAFYGCSTFFDTGCKGTMDVPSYSEAYGTALLKNAGKA